MRRGDWTDRQTRCQECASMDSIRGASWGGGGGGVNSVMRHGQKKRLTQPATTSFMRIDSYTDLCLLTLMKGYFSVRF